MGAFICQVSDSDWPICKLRGIYGNRENKPDSSGPLRVQDRLSVIRDMIAIRPGDFLFFHVIGKEFGPSGLYGPYQAKSIPYYDTSLIWKNKLESFPFRVSFEPYTGYEDICKTDLCIAISDIYAAIEGRSIWSLATLENERNIEKRAVRKIAKDDAGIILRLCLREFSENSLLDSTEKVSVIKSSLPGIPMKSEIRDIGRYENAIKALLMHKLADKDSSCVKIFPNYIDFMNETFVAPTTRKLIDVLIISQESKHTKHFYIVEAKTEEFKFNDLRQLLLYIDLFRQRPIFNQSEDKISACALAHHFDINVVHFKNLHNFLCPYDPILLVKYEPNFETNDAELIELPLEIPKIADDIDITPAKWQSSFPKDDIVKKAIDMLNFYSLNKHVTRRLKKQIDNNGFIIEEMSNYDSSIIKMYFVFVSDDVFSAFTLKYFFKILYLQVAPLVSLNFRVIAPVIISRGYEPTVLNYISMINVIKVRRSITVYYY